MWFLVPENVCGEDVGRDESVLCTVAVSACCVVCMVQCCELVHNVLSGLALLALLARSLTFCWFGCDRVSMTCSRLSQYERFVLDEARLGRDTNWLFRGDIDLPTPVMHSD